MRIHDCQQKIDPKVPVTDQWENAENHGSGETDEGQVWQRNPESHKKSDSCISQNVQELGNCL